MNRVWGIVPLFALLFMASSAGNSQAVRTEFAATELLDLATGPAVGSIVPGIVICPGGNEPTGNPFFPCPPGTRTAIRGMTIMARVTGTGENSQLVTGWNLIEENANYNANLTGQLWGKFTLTLDDGRGTWEGVFTAVRTVENGQPKETFHILGHGSGGIVDGMQLNATMINAFPRPLAVAGVLQGTILQLPRTE